MIEVEITEGMKERAQENSRYIIRNEKASIRGSGGAFVGSLGTLVVADHYGAEIIDTWRTGDYATTVYDMLIDGQKIEVKTKQRSVPPRPFYEASITAQSLQMLDPDYFVFVSLYNLEKAYIMGAIQVDEFMGKATPYMKGEVDPSNNYRVPKDCYSIVYEKLYDLEVLV